MRPIVVSIAGSDSSAGAGVQADLKAIEANGAYAATVLTAITAQNTRGVARAHALAPDLVAAQLDAVFDDLDVVAAKTGMLAEAGVIEAVADSLARRAPRHVVVDPVMISKGGFPLLADDAIATVRERLVPLATVVTPNVHEAFALTGVRVRGEDDAEDAGRALVDAGARAALITGGHLEGGDACDVLVERGAPPRVTRLHGERLEARHTHGTGCTLASALAAQLAHGRGLAEAARAAKRYVAEAIRAGLPVGGGIGPTDPFWFLHRPGAGPVPWERS